MTSTTKLMPDRSSVAVRARGAVGHEGVEGELAGGAARILSEHDRLPFGDVATEGLGQHGGVYATTGGDDKSQAALALGAAAAIDHTREDFAERVRELTGGRGVDVIVDPIGGEVTERGMTCLAPFGRLVICGHTAGPAAAIGTKDLHRHHRSVLGYSTGYLRRTRPESLRPAVEEVFRQAAVGALRVDVAARLPLAKAADAQRLVEDRSAIGRVLLATDDHHRT